MLKMSKNYGFFVVLFIAFLSMRSYASDMFQVTVNNPNGAKWVTTVSVYDAAGLLYNELNLTSGQTSVIGQKTVSDEIAIGATVPEGIRCWYTSADASYGNRKATLTLEGGQKSTLQSTGAMVFNKNPIVYHGKSYCPFENF